MMAMVDTENGKVVTTFHGERVDGCAFDENAARVCLLRRGRDHDRERNS
jgi:hypothetical protein